MVKSRQRRRNLLLQLLCILVCAVHIIQGSTTQVGVDSITKVHSSSPLARHLQLQGNSDKIMNRGRGNSRRLMIGSTRPNCTYNECRGCKYKCIAEQIPVDGDDPINSSYHYRCVCHR